MFSTEAIQSGFDDMTQQAIQNMGTMVDDTEEKQRTEYSQIPNRRKWIARFQYSAKCPDSLNNFHAKILGFEDKNSSKCMNRFGRAIVQHLEDIGIISRKSGRVMRDENGTSKKTTTIDIAIEELRKLCKSSSQKKKSGEKEKNKEEDTKLMEAEQLPIEDVVEFEEVESEEDSAKKQSKSEEFAAFELSEDQIFRIASAPPKFSEKEYRKKRTAELKGLKEDHPALSGRRIKVLVNREIVDITKVIGKIRVVYGNQ